MSNIANTTILILATNGFEQLELTVPRDELRKAGAQVEVASLDGKSIRGWNVKDWGETVDVDLKIADVKPGDYQFLVLPGGQINPDLLRVDADAMNVVKEFIASGKTVAAICHAPWLLIEADALRGKTATSFKSIKIDVKNAGANWVDEPVVADGNIITSRCPDDLQAFVGKIIEAIALKDEKRKVA